MQTLINKCLSSMLDELLEYALVNKPNIYFSFGYPKSIYWWNGLKFHIEHHSIIDEYFIIITLFGRKRKFKIDNNQRAMVKKIFERWVNNNANNNTK